MSFAQTMRTTSFDTVKLLLKLPFLFVRRLRFRFIEKFLCISILFFIVFQYFFLTILLRERVPSSIVTRLHPDRPISVDFRSFEVCPRESFRIDEIVRSFHQQYENSSDEICFLIEHLDGGPWWSYVSQEFAEILTELKEIGENSNVTYRLLPNLQNFTYDDDLRHIFLQACHINENISRNDQPFIIVLFWDVNVLPWYEMRDKWNELFHTTRIQFSIFVDDLHFSDQDTFRHHQYIFQSLSTEIFSTYPYLFPNYHENIPENKITWLAHSASKFSSKSLNQSAENRLFVSGANLMDWYPCRTLGFALCRSNPDLFACLKHPGYGVNMKNSSSFHYGGIRYFSYMRRFVFGLSTCESVRYAIAKFFEIPANGLVLVTTNESVSILERLGFSKNEDFFVVDCSNGLYLKQNVQEFQELPTKTIERIRKQGQNKVHRRHLTTHRAELLHVRLLSQALFISTNDVKEKEKWSQWGKVCVDIEP